MRLGARGTMLPRTAAPCCHAPQPTFSNDASHATRQAHVLPRGTRTHTTFEQLAQTLGDKVVALIKSSIRFV